mmetsp:Transcript_1596/g.2598  ORF Transcript_1596/g.2598 Transcript_1596/m.2598 type:complete len:206 (+) Transcript_1596:168-785(+)
MQPRCLESMIAEESRYFFRRAFRQRSHQCALPAGDTRQNFRQEIVDLPLGRSHFDDGIKDTSRAQDQFRDFRNVGVYEGPLTILGVFGGEQTGSGLLHFPVAWCCRHKNALLHPCPEFRFLQRAIVERRGQPEPVAHKRLLTHAITKVHAAHLRNRNVRLVHYQQPVSFWKVIHKTVWWLARLPTRQVPCVILDPSAIAHRFNLK